MNSSFTGFFHVYAGTARGSLEKHGYTTYLSLLNNLIQKNKSGAIITFTVPSMHLQPHQPEYKQNYTLHVLDYDPIGVLSNLNPRIGLSYMNGDMAFGKTMQAVSDSEKFTKICVTASPGIGPVIAYALDIGLSQPLASIPLLTKIQNTLQDMDTGTDYAAAMAIGPSSLLITSKGISVYVYLIWIGVDIFLMWSTNFEEVIAEIINLNKANEMAMGYSVMALYNDTLHINPFQIYSRINATNQIVRIKVPSIHRYIKMPNQTFISHLIARIQKIVFTRTFKSLNSI